MVKVDVLSDSTAVPWCKLVPCIGEPDTMQRILKKPVVLMVLLVKSTGAHLQSGSPRDWCLVSTG